MFNLKKSFILFAAIFSLGTYGEDRCIKLENLNTEFIEETCLISTSKPDQKFTLIEFFTTTCSTCKKNLPLLKVLHDKWNDILSIKIVSLNPQKGLIEDFIEDYKAHINYPVYFDQRREAKRKYKVRLVPTLLLFKEGVGQVFRHTGKMDDVAIQKIESFFKEER